MMAKGPINWSLEETKTGVKIKMKYSHKGEMKTRTLCSLLNADFDRLSHEIIAYHKKKQF